MGGGTLQLILTEKKQKVKTYSQPKLTFFKAVVKQYHNYAAEPIQLSFDFIDVKEFESSILTVKIPKYAPLVTNLSLHFRIPSLKSQNTTIEVKWKEPILLYLVKSVDM